MAGGGTKIGEQVTKQPSPLQLEKYLCWANWVLWGERRHAERQSVTEGLEVTLSSLSSPDVRRDECQSNTHSRHHHTGSGPPSPEYCLLMEIRYFFLTFYQPSKPSKICPDYVLKEKGKIISKSMILNNRHFWPQSYSSCKNENDKILKYFWMWLLGIVQLPVEIW